MPPITCVIWCISDDIETVPDFVVRFEKYIIHLNLIILFQKRMLLKRHVLQFFYFFFTIGEIRNLIIIYKYIVQSVAARRKKKHKLNKYVIPLIVGFMLIKSILLPIALKTLAILSGKAVVLSLMSLILAAIVGLKKVAQGGHSGGSYEVLTVPHNKYKRQDYLDTGDDLMDTEPYKFYRERRRRK